MLLQCCNNPRRLISSKSELTSILYDKSQEQIKNINLKLINPFPNRIQKRKTSFNNYYNYKISENSDENPNKENNFKNEQTKSNANDPTLSNTNLFGQNSLNINKTNNNNITSINNNPLIVNDEEKNCEKLPENNLLLEIMKSRNLPEGYKLIIRNKHGLENSLIKRKLKENEVEEDTNVVYFGFQREEDLNANPFIDYLLYPKEDFYDDKFIGRHFQIRYDTDSKLYYIKDLGFGFGTFIKLIKDIKKKTIF